MSASNALSSNRYSITFTVTTVFAIGLVLILSIALALQYHFSKSIAVNAALSHYQTAAKTTQTYLKGVDQSVEQTGLLLAKIADLTDNTGLHLKRPVYLLKHLRRIQCCMPFI